MDNAFPVKFNGEYYDLKKFMSDHPGGVDTLKNYKGRSIAQAMLKFGHSNSAYHMMNDFKMNGNEKDVHLTDEVSENGRIITGGGSNRNVEEIKFLEELEARLDWSKPLLCQLDAIAPHYDTWVNSAVYRECRLFASPLLESLFCTPWYLVPMFWIPIILYLGVTQYLELVACKDSCRQTPLTTLNYIYHIVLGVLLWTALEYLLHRWVFHFNPGSSVIMIKLHFFIHGMHHKVPFDAPHQVFPPLPALATASTIFYCMFLPFVTLPLTKFIGFLIGYLTYDMVHYYLHQGTPRDGTYLHTMKRYHSNHHFMHHDKAFGVTSILWDLVFRTFVNVKNIAFRLHY